MSKGELKTNLFDKALGWYQSGDSGKKAAAMELFPKEMLENEISNFKKRDLLERQKTREKELQDVLEECKKLFPVGTPIWSDDGSDHCVNIIVEEPHIEKSEYRVPYEKYSYNDKLERKTVVARVVRLEYFGNDVIEGGWGKSYAGLEKCLLDMKKKKCGESFCGYKNHLIDLKDLYAQKMEERNKEIEKTKNEIAEHQKALDKLQKELTELEAYDPRELTKEKIQEIVERYEK